MRHILVSLCLVLPEIVFAQQIQKVYSIETDAFNGNSILANSYILLLPGFTVDGNSNVSKFYTYSIDTTTFRDTTLCLMGIKKEVIFTQGDSAIIEARSVSATRYNWKGPDNFASISQKAKISIQKTGSYQYFVTNNKHCSSSQDTVQVIIKLKPVIVKPDTLEPEIGKDKDFQIYNAISPNGDGKNDVFFINGISEFPKNKIQIFNRWGDIVYSEGKYNNESVVFDGDHLPSGTYYYILDKGNGDKLLKGFIILSR